MDDALVHTWDWGIQWLQGVHTDFSHRFFLIDLCPGTASSHLSSFKHTSIPLKMLWIMNMTCISAYVKMRSGKGKILDKDFCRNQFIRILKLQNYEYLVWNLTYGIVLINIHIVSIIWHFIIVIRSHTLLMSCWLFVLWLRFNNHV